MNTWIRQKGYPVLMLDRSSDNKTYTVTQERFLTDPEVKELTNQDSNCLYSVPTGSGKSSIPRLRELVHAARGGITQPRNLVYLVYLNSLKRWCFS